MKTVNNYYVDDRNNKWSKSIYTEDQAEKNSKSLINCSDCSRCSRCSDCSHCSDCSGCSDCSDCSHCSRCCDCSDCSGCSGYKSNPSRLCKVLHGTCKSLACVYWLNDDVQTVFGCWKGKSLEEFREKSKEQVSSDRLRDFLEFINVAEYCIKNM